MAARRCSLTSICRGRWAGSPAFTRCGWMPGRSISARRFRAGRRWAGRSSCSSSRSRWCGGFGCAQKLLMASSIEVNALTVEGSQGARLQASWSWAAALLSDADAQDLARSWFAALEALVRHADGPGAGGRSPCDLPLVSLSQGAIERLEGEDAWIEDLRP